VRSGGYSAPERLSLRYRRGAWGRLRPPSSLLWGRGATTWACVGGLLFGQKGGESLRAPRCRVRPQRYKASCISSPAPSQTSALMQRIARGERAERPRTEGVRGEARDRGYGQRVCEVEARDRNHLPRGLWLPNIDFLPRRGMCTRVYTMVYPRVHNCILTCTQPRSRYVRRRPLVYTSPGLMSRWPSRLKQRSLWKLM